MLTLKLFGTPAIEVTGGGPIVGRAAQGHRLGLLAALALARGSPITRDKLIALLWPDSATDRARHQLSDALYILRTAIGADAIHATGDDLALSAESVTSDVGTFERLLEEGEPEAALELFSGPLLDGFHVPDSGDFEHWLDAQRARLDRCRARAIETLAEASEAGRDFVGAAAWWRRLAALDPYSGRVALRLMRAMEASGDPAGALRHARIHAALLQQEFETGPDPDLRAFVERLRAAPPVRATPAPTIGPPARWTDPDERSPAPSELVRSAGDTPSMSDRAEPATIQARRAPSEGALASGGRGWVRRRPAAALAAVVVLLALAVAWSHGISRARGAPLPAKRSLAVLPFVNMSADPANAYFSDGLSEQIITALSEIEGLRVAARTSSFALRDGGLDVRVIGDTLGVEAVLEGSVRREGSRLRVTAQLIDAASGYQIWSEEYDREVADALALQDEIAGAIAAALELRLPARAAPSRARRALDPVAYDLYLRALHLRDDLSGEALLSATSLLDRAIELEPGFALAWAEKASVAAPSIYFGHVSREQGMAEMRAAIAQALELDPELGEAHVALGVLRLFFEWDWEGAGRALRQAVAFNPNDPHAWHHLGNQLDAAGRIEEAVEARARSAALDPLNARMRIVLASALHEAGRHDEAVAQYERARRLDPMNPNMLGLGPARPTGATIYLAGGHEKEAVQELLRVAMLRDATPGELDALRAAFGTDGMRGVWRSWLDMDLRQSGGVINPLRRSMLHASIGDVDEALEWLELAHAERNPGLIFLKREHAFAALRSHSRFGRVMAEMKFPTR